MKIVLQVRELSDGAPSQQPFDDEDAAIRWLRARPRFKEVIGVANAHLPPAVDARLRAALRPLDEEERKMERELGARRDAETEARAERLMRQQAAESALAAEAARHADPNRLMSVHWTFDGCLRSADAADDRPLTDEVRQAVEAWIAERNEWVRGRGQVVGDARLLVWPGPVPAGASGRVDSGSFIPVTAPAKKG
jgi:hypothetical protein